MLGSGRIPSLFFVGLLLVSTLAAFAPTAAAAASTSEATPTVTIVSNGGSNNQFHMGTVFKVNVTGTWSGTCTATGVRQLGLTITMPEFTSSDTKTITPDGTTGAWAYEAQYTVNKPDSADGSTTKHITAVATPSCVLAGQTTDVGTAQTKTSAELVLDTVLPRTNVVLAVKPGTATSGSTSGAGIGSTVVATPAVNATTTDAASYTLDMRQFNASFVPIASTPIASLQPVEVVVGQTGFDRPLAFFNVTDNAGNVNTTYLTGAVFNASVPRAVTNVALAHAQNGSLVLTFDPPRYGSASGSVDVGVTDYIVNVTPRPSGTPTSYTVRGVGTGTQTSYPPNLVENQDYGFQVAPITGWGNQGPTTPSTSAIIHDIPQHLDVSFNNVNVVGTAFPTLAGTYSGHSNISNVQLTLWNMTDNTEWNGAAWATPAGGSHFTQTGSAAKSDSNGGTWSYSGYSGLATQAGTSKSFQVNVTLTDAAALVATNHASVIVDRAAPSLTASTDDTVPTAIMQGVPGVIAHLQATDTGSGVSSFSVRLLNADDTVATKLSGAAATLACSAVASVDCTLATTHSGTTYEGNATLTFNGVPLGDYKLAIAPVDGVGNTGAFVTFPEPIHISPRVIIDSSHPPVIDTSNMMTLYLYAANESVSTDPRDACTATHICRVGQVDIRVRLDSETSDGTTVRTIGLPRPIGAGETSFNYTPDGGAISVGARDRFHVQVAAVATYVDVDGASHTVSTPWIAATTTDTVTGALVLLSPPVDGAVVMPRDDGTVNLTARFTRDSLASAPFARYWLNDSATGAVVQSATNQGAAFVPSGDTLVAPTGPQYFYNLSLTGLAANTYNLSVLVVGNTSGGNVVLASVHQKMGVETAKPSIVFPTSPSEQPEVANGLFTSQSFNLTANITTGLARLSPSGLSVRVYADKPAPPHYLAAGTFTATLKSLTLTTDKAHYNATWQIVLPSEAVDAYHYDIVVNATSDSVAADTPSPSVIGIKTIFVDSSAPVPDISVATSQATVGFASGDDIRFIGNSNDTVSGTKTVEINLFDETHNKTFKWTASTSGSWVAGHVDSWATSDLVPVSDGSGGTISGYYIQNVKLGHQPVSGGERTTWVLNNTKRPIYTDTAMTHTFGNANAIGLDPGTNYTVRVRVTDYMGHVAETSTTLHFDAVLPVVGALTLPSSSSGVIGGAGSDSYTITASASDNSCLRSLVLHGLAPSGVNLSAPMVPPSGVTCATSHGTTLSYSLDLLNVPSMRYESGVWRYSLEAIDTAGNSVSSDGVSIWVRDDFAPVVKNLTLQPSTIGAGSTTRISAEIVENHNVQAVTVRVLAKGSSTPLKVGTMIPSIDSPPSAANGTGLYVADLRADLGLDLKVGNYTIDVFADDNRTVDCASCPVHVSRPLVVVAEAPPDIFFERPAVGVHLVAPNATLSLRATGKALNVTDLAVAINGVALPASALNASYPGVNRTVMVVTFSAGARAHGDALNITVDLRPAAGLPASTSANFVIDALAPTVNATVTGNRTIGTSQWAAKGATLTLAASDDSGAAPLITYTVTGRAPATYTAPLLIAGQDGAWNVDYTATDSAGNAATGHFSILIDGTGPTVSVIQAAPSAEGERVNVTVNDGGTGVNDSTVEIHYAFGDSPTSFVKLAMARVTGTPIFTATLTGNVSEGLSYFVVASDNLGNVGANGTQSAPNVIAGAPVVIVENTAPTINIARPLANQVVKGSVAVTYTADDIETARDALKVTLSLHGPDGNNRNLVVDAANTGKYTLDSTVLAPGTYTLVVVVSDGELHAQDQRTFTVAATEPVQVLAAPPTNASVDGSVPFAVALNAPAGKTIRQATWTAFKDGVKVTDGILTARAAGGYAGTFSPTEAGTYTIKVQSTYEDGSADTAGTTIGTVTVAAASGSGTPAGGPPASFVVLLVLAAATIALAAYGAFVRWKP